MRGWTWWQGGIALGLLSTFAMVLLKPMGVSTPSRPAWASC
ncbi:hypothetical protein [Symbiobacterium thermophilum]|nr:hypothetical protein [Symbiobacterium thermophilum]